MTNQELGKGTIKYEIDGASEEQIHRMRDNMDILVAQGILNLHDGKAILDFNYEGKICLVRFEFNKWKRGKSA